MTLNPSIEVQPASDMLTQERYHSRLVVSSFEPTSPSRRRQWYEAINRDSRTVYIFPA
ncbi:hypothetical protein VTK73DRAFT_3393 [Phialemonium thermophilum]|uniref:PH domain-containing protein n=1 Tax=Phialemonium thermophilum TaxID=223376 RepID=A0ABR3VJI6_9PEZI